jgi:hypothetical protein
MKRRRHKLQVSTFPFLAVLLSAMGSLILVLLAVDQKARAAARAKVQREAALVVEKAAQEAAARRAEMERKKQEAVTEWERKRDELHHRLTTEERELQSRMSQLQQQLAEAIIRLREEQDETGQLRRRLDVERGLLEGAERSLAQARNAQADVASHSEARHALLARMTKDVEQLERALAELKATRERDKQTYSVVPYRGRHGESRRPLYVECAADKLIFHPDRHVLTDSSPAVEVRAEVERRFARQKELLAATEATANHPYLMVLVRPNGVNSYYHLQGALRGLDVEFGYEFIDADWLLDFPADDALAKAPPWVETTRPPAASPSRGSGIARRRTESGFPAPGDFTIPGSSTPPLPHISASGGKGWREGAEGLTSTGQPGAGGQGGAFPPGGVPGPAPGVLAKGTPPKPPQGIVEILPPSITQGEEGAPSINRGQEKVGGANHQPTSASAGTNGSASSQPQVFPSQAVSGFQAPSPLPGDLAASGSDRTPGRGPLSPQSPLSGLPVASGPSTPAKPQPPTDKPALTDKLLSPARPGTGASASSEQTDDVAGRIAPRSPTVSERRLPPLRPLSLSGDRDWVIYVECTAEGVLLYPSRVFIPLAALSWGPSNPLQKNIQQMIDRRQTSVRPGEAPYRPQVRFLVRPDSMRVYHAAYPALDALQVPKSRYNLKPEDDVLTIVTGH